MTARRPDCPQPATRAWRAGGAATLAACLALAACTVPSSPPSSSAPASAPGRSSAAPGTIAAATDPFAALLAGRTAGPLLRVTDDALIAITVRRGGALARLGHDHVVAARRIDGRVDPAAGLAVLRFRLDEMTVDEAALRRDAGLATQPSADAIAGTRVNMLTRVLDAERFPWVEVRARRAPQAPQAGAQEPIVADITLHGVTRRHAVQATVDSTAQGVTARGALTLRQTDFGIVPFSVMGGALAVQDTLEIRFVLPARPVAPDAVR